MPPDSSRRDFLTGRAVTRAAQDATERLVDSTLKGSAASPQASTASPNAAGGGYLLQYAARAMACEFEVTLAASRQAGADPLPLEALQLVETLEQQLTVYQPTSELSAINAHAGERPIEVEPRLFELLQFCGQLHQQTDGAFDITSTPLSRVWGFFRRQGQVPDAEALAAARACVGFQHVQLNSAARTVFFTRPGIELNLGAIGKGYALDRCGEFMRQRGAESFLWHAGQSSLLAAGHQPGQTALHGWPIEIGNPLRPGKPLGTLRMVNAGVGTSGSSQQFFRHEGKRYGHVIDPRSGQPAEQVLFVTVLAPMAAAADALSTAFYILGPEHAEEFCQRNPGHGFVMLARKQADGPVSLRSAGLADAQLVLGGGLLRD